MSKRLFERLRNFSAALAAAVLFLPAEAETEPCQSLAAPFVISFLKVGLGDSILISCPDKKEQALIDGGDSNAQYEGAEALFHTSLHARLRGDTHLETVVATHAHPDHVAGLASLAKSGAISVGTYFESIGKFSGAPFAEEAKRRFAARGSQIVSIPVAFEDPIPLTLCRSSGERASAHFLPVPHRHAVELGCPANLNDCSLKLALQFDRVKVLLLADATTRWEKVASETPALRPYLDSQILKAGHHGSPYSTSSRLLRAASPEIVIISAGNPDHPRSIELGYPGFETLRRIGKFYRTSGAALEKTILGCRKSGSTCEWRPVQVPRQVFSTTADSIDIAIEGNAACITQGEETFWLSPERNPRFGVP